MHLPLARPPTHEATVRTWVLDSFSELSSLRGTLAHALTRGRPLEPTQRAITETMVLVSSELATNALTHAAPPITVTLHCGPKSYLLDVTDTTPTVIPAIAQGRAVGEGGFGLLLATQLSTQIGWYPAGATKHIWATFPTQAFSSAA